MTGTGKGLALVIGAVLLLGGASERKKDEAIMFIACENVPLVRAIKDKFYPGIVPRDLVARLKELKRAGLCVTSTRGKWPDGLVSEREIGRMNCLGSSCVAVIRTDIFELLEE